MAIGCGGRAPAGQAEDRVCQGGRLWHGEDAQAFAGCRTVEGDLELGGALLDASSLSSLVDVQGNLRIGPSYQLNNLSDLSLLKRVGGDLVIKGNFVLAGLFLGALIDVGGDLVVEGNPGLGSLSLHHLRRIGGDLLVKGGNGHLQRVDLSELTSLAGGPLTNDWQKALPEAVRSPAVY